MPAQTQRKTLTRFSITDTDGGFRLHIEDDAGETIEFEATADQLEVIADALDDTLDKDDTLDEV